MRAAITIHNADAHLRPHLREPEFERQQQILFAALGLQIARSLKREPGTHSARAQAQQDRRMMNLAAIARVNGEERLEVAEGDGPVNALDAAMRKALNGDFPGLRDMRLIDYKVRVVNSEAGTAARIRPSISPVSLRSNSVSTSNVWS